MLADCHDCLFLWIPDDSRSVAWPCLPRSWFPEVPYPYGFVERPRRP